ncbi:glycoside hydrolase family 20 protein [Chitinophaga flava]|uniref:beta-N-acetylhexosaminidase n=1 Tax=Chitinophaga flava TaxID=2259036 RepID=A0A365XQX5_9BACT|nr:family 20 glycosylhydrolase [Chitinophaga flava]RBL87965.1 beta-N-acetylhexosaminidase [Chitinophaga flava]
MFKHCVSALVLTACSILPGKAQYTGNLDLIPRPAHITAGSGFFRMNAKGLIFPGKDFRQAAQLLQKMGTLPSDVKASPHQSAIIFKRANAAAIPHPDGYQISISPANVTIQARSEAGAINAALSLLQLSLLQPDPSLLPCANISDQPRFGYRGVHLDVSRNYFPTAYVKRFIDLMALYRMNTFHWHLTDGAGWRLEIKRYPELIRQAAWRTHGNWKEWWKNGDRRYSHEGDPNAYGGYYTQQEARDIVAYAAARGITVIPEIEMPGHSEEVLAIYPEFSCSGIPYKNSEFCLGNDSTFSFLQNVLDEVISIFPSKYIHIGGDEASTKAWKQCPKCQQRIQDEHLKDEKELQSYAIRRMEKFLLSRHRKLLGWDEILEGGLAPEATVMSWRGESGGIAAAREGHDVVMTPGSHCYFDSYQADPATQPEAISGYLPLEKVYSYEPVPRELNAAAAQHVLGAQANIWTEYIPHTNHLEYMVYPRLIALSEVVWSDTLYKNWDNFQQRLQSHYHLLQRLNVNYYRPSYVVNIHPEIDITQHQAAITFSSEQYKPTIRYTLDGKMPDKNSSLYTGRFTVSGSAIITAAIFQDTIMKGKPTVLAVDDHLALGKKVIYNRPYNEKYAAQKEATLVNGYRGSLTYGDGQWQGFLGDMDVTVDLEKVISLHNLSINFMQLTGPGVYIPAWVEVQLSDDGKNFRTVQQVNNDVPVSLSTLAFKDFKFDLKDQQARYIRVHARNEQRGFMFADEIIVY